MLRDSLSLAWKLGLGALTLTAGLGALGALLSGSWQTALALSLIAAAAGWALRRSLRQHLVRRDRR